MLSYYKKKGYSLTVWITFEDIAHIPEPANRFDKEEVFDVADELAATILEDTFANTPVRFGTFDTWIDGDDIFVNYRASLARTQSVFDG